MSAEATLNTALLAHGALTVLVGTRIFRGRYPPGETYPLCVFLRVGTDKTQPVTGAVITRSVRFQIKCYADKSAGGRAATTVAEAVEDALVAAIGSFIDVTLIDELAQWNPESELYSQTVECECLEAA